MNTAQKPVIVQSDGSILLEVATPVYEQARDAISPFAELLKSPEYVHTYRITPLSIWNAAAMGISQETILERLSRYTRYEIPPGVIHRIRDSFSRWDAIRMFRIDESSIMVETRSEELCEEIVSKSALAALIMECVSPERFIISSHVRGRFKHMLIKLGYPANDLVGYEQGEPLEIALRRRTLSGEDFSLRPYQQDASDHFWAGGGPTGGQGIVVLPCGSGKTMVGMAVMTMAQTYTLILCTNVSAVHQWISELIDKTHLSAEMIGEYTGMRKDIRPLTVTTYQILTFRKSRDGPFEHMNLMKALNWGLIVYDEAHVVPAPVFRATAEIQAKRRLGLTATLIREDGLEEDTFSLVGPKCYDVPWKELEQKGFIAQAQCCEVRVPLPYDALNAYISSGERIRFRVAAENRYKEIVVKHLLKKHPDEAVLIIGQYISQLKRLSASLKAPLITGSTPNGRRDMLYDSFRRGDIPVLVVSKVANFAIDLPDASVAIQVSGTFGSRQEEAQRLGRILRPKERVSTFYTLVSNQTTEETFALKRQVFLAEQGYRYRIEEWSSDDLDA